MSNSALTELSKILDSLYEINSNKSHIIFKEEYPEKYHQLENEYILKYPQALTYDPKPQDFDLTEESLIKLKNKIWTINISDYINGETSDKRDTAFKPLYPIIFVLSFLYLFNGLTDIISSIIFALVISWILGGIARTILISLFIKEYKITNDEENYFKYIENMNTYNKVRVKIGQNFIDNASRIYETLYENRTKERMNKINYWKSLITPDGIEFENAVERLFVDLGYKTNRTPKTGDEGVDIIANKNGEIIAIQCKAHTKKLGASVVRELYGSMMHCNANQAILATINGVTENSEQFIKGKKIRILTAQDYINFADDFD